MNTCPDCGERVYGLGCTNCNEAAYIEEQIALTDSYGEDDPDEEHDCGEDTCVCPPHFQPRR